MLAEPANLFYVEFDKFQEGVGHQGLRPIASVAYPIFDLCKHKFARIEFWTVSVGEESDQTWWIGRQKIDLDSKAIHEIMHQINDVIGNVHGSVIYYKH